MRPYCRVNTKPDDHDLQHDLRCSKCMLCFSGRSGVTWSVLLIWLMTLKWLVFSLHFAKLCLDGKNPRFSVYQIPLFVCLFGYINIECEIGIKREAERGRTSSVMLFAPYSSSPAHVCMCPCGLVAGGRIDQIVTSSTFIKVLFIFSGLTFLVKRCVICEHKHPWTLWTWVKNSRAALFVWSGEVSGCFSMVLVVSCGPAHTFSATFLAIKAIVYIFEENNDIS